jgi:bifunctional UDP-N-acetylglucosamine pyrophosphorylase/glucosamine-1-phosphate N-acetyltransferase
MLAHALRAGGALEPELRLVVAGHGAEEVGAALSEIDPEAQIVLQEEQKGTGHAVAVAREALNGFEGDVIVLYGDTPFIRPETLGRMIDARADHDIVVLGFEAADPGRYGRLLTDGDTLDRIVEFRDANAAEREITLCNSGLMAAKASVLLELVDRLGNDNAAQEYYLTDAVALARSEG